MAQDALQEKIDIQSVADEQQVGLSDDFVREIRDLLADDNTDRVQELCIDLSAADMAEILMLVTADERLTLVNVLADGLYPETFVHLDRAVLNDLLEQMDTAQVAGIVNRLESDDAFNLIKDLKEERRTVIMRNLSRKVRVVVEEGLTFPEDSAGRLMQREFVAIPQFWTVGKTVDYLRAAAETLPHMFYDLFIVDPMHKFVGEITLSRVLCAQRSVKVDTLVVEEYVTIPVAMDQEQVAHLFRRNNLLSAPVLDDVGRLIGIITIDDIVDVIDEEAEEDFLKLGGVSDSDIFLSAFSTVRARFGWLVVNLLTAFAATFVISRFEAEIEKIVALAVLMPIVASMGGNAGMQSLAVAIRGLATKELTASNAGRVIVKELFVGGMNGLLFGAVMIGFIAFWYQDLQLALIMAAAMVVNLLVAGLSGALIPIWLQRAGFDPAHAGAILLTTVTDVIGFLAFLGMAALFLV